MSFSARPENQAAARRVRVVCLISLSLRRIILVRKTTKPVQIDGLAFLKQFGYNEPRAG